MSPAAGMPEMTRQRVPTVVRKLRGLGPDPILLFRYVKDRALTRARQRRLRNNYDDLVANHGETATLLLAPLELPIAADLPNTLLAAATRLRLEAEQIVDHRVDLLGSGLVPLGKEIDWHRDFKSGYRWEPAFYQDVQVTRLDGSSDAKVPWELSRAHQLLTLARAARLYEEERFAVELERQLASWLDENPTGFGINWANPMEIALRAVNWVWALRTLEDLRPLEASLRTRVTRALQAHARHIAANLEGTPYLRSNHYLSDVLGLLVLGATLDGDAHAARAFDHAHRALEREITTQVHDDGVGFEGSLPYHGLALEIFLIARVAAGWAGRPFSARYDERLRRMLEASRTLRHPDGRFPQFGDSDSGRVLPAGFARPPSVDNLLWLGASILGEAAPSSGAPHEEVAWTLGLAAWRAAVELPAASEPSSAAFRQSGFFVLRSTPTHAVVRCGDVGQNGNGGHAHNDLLSFELSCGKTFVVDSGTFLYTADPAARNEFRSTRAHSTVVVANSEINPLSRELFSLRQVARPALESWEEGVETVRVTLSHNGYRRLDPAVVHRRTFVLERATGQLTIADELHGRGTTEAVALLHLAPDVNVVRTAPGQWELRLDEEAISLSFNGLELDLAEGWVSDRYGRRELSPLIVGCVAGELPLRFGFSFAPVAEAREALSVTAAGTRLG